MTQPTTAPPDPAAPTAPPVAPTPTPSPPPAAAPPAGAPVDLAAELAAVKAEAERWKHHSRTNEDRYKTTSEKLTAQETILKQLAEKAGITIDGAPDPAQLAAQLTAAQSTAQQRAIELAVFKAASAAGGNPDALLDSRAFMSKTAGLDLNDPDLTEKVKALVAETVTANPTLAAAPNGQPLATPPAPQAPAISGGNFSGAPTGQRQWTDQDVARATPAELNKAISDGLLTNMGIGRGRRR